jgi:hypothetical protein
VLRALTQNRTLVGTGAALEQAANAELSRLLAAVPSGGGGGGGGGAGTTGEQVLLANSIWSRKGVPLKKSYVDAMKTAFQVGEGAVGAIAIRHGGARGGSMEDRAARRQSDSFERSTAGA